MRERLAHGTVAATLVAMLAGCVTQSVDRTELPVEWRQALPTSGKIAGDVSGAYLVRGQLLTEKSVRRGQTADTWLFDLFFAHVERPFDGHTVELRRPDPKHQEIIVSNDSGVVAERRIDLELEKGTGAVVVHAPRPDKEDFPFIIAASHAAYLFKGSDGWLYVRMTGSLMVVFAGIPGGGRFEQWARFEPATPEKAAAYAAEENTLRRLSRGVPLRRGERFPDFADVADWRGQALTRRALDGRVVLLHVASTKSNDPAVIEAVKAAHRKYHPRGLEVLTVWVNRDAKQDAVESLIATHGLAWRHLLVAPTFASESRSLTHRTRGPPYVLILDREGRAAAVNPPPEAIGSTLAALLPEN